MMSATLEFAPRVSLGASEDGGFEFALRRQRGRIRLTRRRAREDLFHGGVLDDVRVGQDALAFDHHPAAGGVTG